VTSGRSVYTICAIEEREVMHPANMQKRQSFLGNIFFIAVALGLIDYSSAKTIRSLPL
jgi:hypothetical protein